VKTFGRFSSHRRFEHQKNISGRIFESGITRDASTAKVEQVFGSDFDHFPL
jgi:hypothetical protein